MTPEPTYPGEAVTVSLLEWPRTGELGEVRLMDYGSGGKFRYRVACFCPGRTVCTPGDTPKTESECEIWCPTIESAREWFALYVSREKADGWIPLTPSGRRIQPPASQWLR